MNINLDQPNFLIVIENVNQKIGIIIAHTNMQYTQSVPITNNACETNQIMKAKAKVTPTNVLIHTHLGKRVDNDKIIIKASKANPINPKIGLGITSNDACQDDMIGPQEINGLMLHDVMCAGFLRSSIFSNVIMNADTKDNKLMTAIAILDFL